MTDATVLLLLALVIVNSLLLAVLLYRSPQKSHEDLDRTLRDEFRTGREESSRTSRELREELMGGAEVRQ